MKSIKKKMLAVMATAAITLLTIATFAFSAGASSYTAIARNDLGMHCACPTFAGFLLLPPYNTIRVQVLQKGNYAPSIVSSGVTVSYALAEETDASLQADPYFAQWVTYAPKLIP